ncbi:MAG: hypothetical protein LBB42_02155 [Coriobacteriales bacterium]|nr:hypothetical protein [Coriobacteriales bacterium]
MSQGKKQEPIKRTRKRADERANERVNKRVNERIDELLDDAEAQALKVSEKAESVGKAGKAEKAEKTEKVKETSAKKSMPKKPQLPEVEPVKKSFDKVELELDFSEKKAAKQEEPELKASQAQTSETEALDTEDSKEARKEVHREARKETHKEVSKETPKEDKTENSALDDEKAELEKAVASELKEQSLEDAQLESKATDELLSSEPVVVHDLDRKMGFKQKDESELGSDAPAASVTPATPLEATPQKRAKKGRGAKLALILLILLLIAALGGLAYLGYTLLLKHDSTQVNPIDTSTTSMGVPITDTAAPPAPVLPEFSTTDIPQLTALFGNTTKKVQSQLGKKYVLTKTDDASDENNPAIKKLAVFVYNPPNQPDLTEYGITPPSVYVSLDEKDKVVAVHYTSSFEMLDYPNANFSTLIASQDTVLNALKAAGVTPNEKFSYPSLTPNDYDVYIDPDAELKKIAKREYQFSGTVDGEDLPKTWLLKLLYDYGTSGIAPDAKIDPNQRTISITLQ